MGDKIKRKPKILSEFKKHLENDNLYFKRDELSLITFESLYLQYLLAKQEVEEKGQTIIILDSNKKEKVITNPAFHNMMELIKELNRMMKEFKSSKKVDAYNEDDPFVKMMKDMNNNETSGRIQ